MVKISVLSEEFVEFGFISGSDDQALTVVTSCECNADLYTTPSE